MKHIKVIGEVVGGFLLFAVPFYFYLKSQYKRNNQYDPKVRKMRKQFIKKLNRL